MVTATSLADSSLSDSYGVLADQLGMAPQLQDVAGTVYGNAVFRVLRLRNLEGVRVGANGSREKKCINRGSVESPKRLRVIFHFFAFAVK